MGFNRNHTQSIYQVGIPLRSETPQYIALLKELEHASMQNNLAPMLWTRAENDSIFDGSGNQWIDFTSAIGIANSGHANKFVCQAIHEVLGQKLLATFNFPHTYRIELLLLLRKMFLQVFGEEYKSHLLSTGTEAVECAVDISIKYGNRKTSVVVSFINDFHGNTFQSKALSGDGTYTKVIHGEKEIYYLKIPYLSRGKPSMQTYSLSAELDSVLNSLDLNRSDVVSIVLEPYQG